MMRMSLQMREENLLIIRSQCVLFYLARLKEIASHFLDIKR